MVHCKVTLLCLKLTVETLPRLYGFNNICTQTPYECLYHYCRNCTYPQSLTLTLETPASLQQIQLLSHEYKIAAKVEIQIATSSQINQTDPTATAFTRLGYLSFDNNERTQHSARELKSVSLTVPEAKLVRFIFHRCFKNRLNVYNQVAIIMINIVGQPLVQHQVLQGPPVTLATGPLSPPPHHHYGAPSGNNNINASHSAGVSPVKPQFPNSNNSSLVVLTNEQQVALLQAELKVDIVTAQHILDMTVQKQEAVAKEEYDEAKRLKHAIDKLKVVGERIALLEAKKVAAVDAEDYDLAKTVKHEVDKLRCVVIFFIVFCLYILNRFIQIQCLLMYMV